MPLPVLTFSSTDLVRLFHQSQLDWCRHLGEETTLDHGTLLTNPGLPDIADANCIMDARVIPGETPRQVIESAGVACRRCSLNAAVPADQTKPLADYLSSIGWLPVARNIFVLQKQSRSTAARAPITIIPARASFGQYRHLLQLANATEQAIEAQMQHLDDSHFDALLAIIDRQPVASIGVLATGEIGTIHQWFVAPNFRRKGIGQLMLDRALEICARSGFRHVMKIAPSDSPSISLLRSTGFASVGEYVTYERP